MKNIKAFFLDQYYRKTIPMNLLLLSMAGFLYSLAQAIFMTKANVFPSGVSAISQLLIYIFPIRNDMFAFINLAFNIPLLIFVWIKYPRKNFVAYTLYFLLSMVVWGLAINSIEFFKTFNPFNLVLNSKNQFQNSDGWAIITYGVISGILVGVSVSLAFIASGSSGGTDLPVVYISYRTGKSIGGVSRLFSFGFVFFAIIANNLVNGTSVIDGLININAIGSYVFIFIYGITLNSIYPKYRKIKLTISVADPKHTLKALRDAHYYHSYTVIEVTSGYTNQKRYQVETIMFYFEQRQFVELILKEDRHAWFAISRINKTIGKFVRKD